MRWPQTWLVLWLISTGVQMVGFGWSNWRWWQARTSHFKYFWFVFVVNWTFTLAHQITWGLAPDLMLFYSSIEALMKLGAMLAEIVLMCVARALESTSMRRG